MTMSGGWSGLPGGRRGVGSAEERFWVSEGFGCGFGVLDAESCGGVSGHRRDYWGLCFYVPHSPPNTEAEVRRCDRFCDMEGQS